MSTPNPLEGYAALCPSATPWRVGDVLTGRDWEYYPRAFDALHHIADGCAFYKVRALDDAGVCPMGLMRTNALEVVGALTLDEFRQLCVGTFYLQSGPRQTKIKAQLDDGKVLAMYFVRENGRLEEAWATLDGVATGDRFEYWTDGRVKYKAGYENGWMVSFDAFDQEDGRRRSL